MIRLIQRTFCKSIVRFSLLVFVLMATVAKVPAVVLAQEQAGTKADSEESESAAQVQVFQLKYADAEMASHVLETMLEGVQDVRLAVGNDRRVIVLGNPDTLATVRETLEVLDQAPEDPSVTKVFSLLHSDADIAAKLVAQVAGDVKIAVDVRTNSLIVSAPSEEMLEKVEVLARILDEGGSSPSSSAVTYKIDLFWLAESDGAEESKSDQVTTADPRIAKALIELGRNGFVGAQQAGHVSVVVRAGGEFGVRSDESLGRLEFEGRIEEVSDRQLDLKLDLRISDDEEETASVMTEINTEPGHDVVIAVANAAHGQRRNAFVIRVEK